MHPTLIHAEKDFLILSKPAGLLMHGIANGKWQMAKREPTLADWLARHYPETAKVGDAPALRPGIVHRLDKDTSGILLIARNQKFFEYAKKLFQTHSIRKVYLALVRGHLERDRNVIEKPIGIKPSTTARSIRSRKMQKDAVTEYHVLRRLARPDFKSTFLEVVPHTGRTHQIRVHLTAIGHPVLGDPLYGPEAHPDWVNRLMLHANKLKFADLNGKIKEFEVRPDKLFDITLRAAGLL